MKNKKDNILILVIALVLILLVGVITVTRNHFQSEKTKDDSNQEESQSSIDLEKINFLEPSELYQKINQKESLIILDVRSQDEYDIEHIIHSQNLSTDFSQKDILPGKSYVVIDSEYSPIGKQLIESLSYPKNFYYLTGGFSTWKNEFYPTISIGDPESIVDRSKTTTISLEDFKKYLGETPPPNIVDLRSSEEFQKEHLKGAMNIPLADLEARYKEIPFGQVIVYGENSLEAFQGNVRLYDLGTITSGFLAETLQELKEKGIEIEAQTEKNSE